MSYEELFGGLRRALLNTGFEAGRADLCARLIADSTRDGVASHGLDFFPRFIRMIRAGIVDVDAAAERVAGNGAVERWDGRRGPGNLNAHACMARAIAISRSHGIGCVALANTNHWMRGGTFGWQAAEAGAIGICWTNTLPNLPPWGAAAAAIGNNPLVVAVPRPAGHVVLDMAMSQFSFGALAAYRARGELLPVAGGYDTAGELTRDPAAIEASARALPIGFWKGSGLAVMLDLIAAVLSEGRATYEIPPRPEEETSLSQVFIAVDLSSRDGAQAVAERIIDHLRPPSTDGRAVRYPGERTLATRSRNLAEGIPVDASNWDFVLRIQRS